jgi:signal transduction histidine kinase
MISLAARLLGALLLALPLAASAAENVPFRSLEAAAQHDPPKLLRDSTARLRQAESSGNKADQLWALRGLVLAHQTVDEFAAAERHVPAGAALANELGDRAALLQFMIVKGTAAENAGRYDEAASHYDQALSLAQEDPLGDGLARVHTVVASLQYKRGRHSDALASFMKAHALAESRKDAFGKAVALAHAGNVITRMEGPKDRQLASAIDFYERALSTIDPAVYRQLAAVLYHNVGNNYLRLGQLDRAKERLERALQMALVLENRVGAGYCHLKLGRIAQAQVRFDDAVAHLDRALPALDRGGDRGAVVDVHLARADMLSRLGRGSESLQSLGRAQEVVEQLGVPERELAYRGTAADVLARLGRYQDAFAQMQASREVERRQAEAASNKRAQRLQVEFETQQKDSENARLRALQGELEARRRAAYAALALGIVLVGVLASALVWRQTRRRVLAEATAAAKSQFLAAASHDLRQPIHALNVYLGIASGLDLPEEAVRLVRDARQCAGAMDEMFHALLDLARLDAAAVQAHKQDFPVSDLLDSVRVQFDPEARAKGLGLRVVRCSATVHSDRLLMERILRNLVSNALRYTERGKVLVGCRRRGKVLRIEVIDTGCGIPEDEQPLVFREFYRAARHRNDAAHGFGLGLAVVQRLAHLLDVRVSLRSMPQAGSLFAVDLPLVTEEVESPLRGIREPRPPLRWQPAAEDVRADQLRNS